MQKKVDDCNVLLEKVLVLLTNSVAFLDAESENYLRFTLGHFLTNEYIK